MKQTLTTIITLWATALGFTPNALATYCHGFQLSDPKTGTLLATGEEAMSAFGTETESISRYRATDGTPLLIERLRYSAQSRLIRLVQDDLSQGTHSSILVDGGRAKLEERAPNGEKDSTNVSWGEQHTVGSLIARLILEQWQALQNGETLRVDLFVPKMAQAFAYCGELSKHTVTMKPCNFLLRAFAPQFAFQMDPASPNAKILTYEGPGPLTLAGESNKRVVMRFGEQLANCPSDLSQELRATH